MKHITLLLIFVGFYLYGVAVGSFSTLAAADRPGWYIVRALCVQCHGGGQTPLQHVEGVPDLPPEQRHYMQSEEGAMRAVKGLDLRTKASALKGGSRGPAYEPGNSSESLMCLAIQPLASGGGIPGPGGPHSVHMPPWGQLPDESVKAICDAIDAEKPTKPAKPSPNSKAKKP